MKSKGWNFHTQKNQKGNFDKTTLALLSKGGGKSKSTKEFQIFFYRDTPYKSLSQFVFENLTHFAPVLAGKIVEN